MWSKAATKLASMPASAAQQQQQQNQGKGEKTYSKGPNNNNKGQYRGQSNQSGRGGGQSYGGQRGGQRGGRGDAGGGFSGNQASPSDKGGDVPANLSRSLSKTIQLCPSGVYPGRRVFGSFSSILDSQYHRSFRTQCCPAWIQSRICSDNPDDHITPTLYGFARDPASSLIGQNKPNAQEGIYKGGNRLQSWVLLNFLSGDKEGRRLEAGPQFEEVKQIQTYENIQDVVPTEGLAVPKQGDWLASLNLKDSYFHVPILPSPKKVRFSEQSLSVSRPSIWAKHRFKSVYKGVLSLQSQELCS